MCAICLNPHVLRLGFQSCVLVCLFWIVPYSFTSFDPSRHLCAGDLIFALPQGHPFRLGENARRHVGVSGISPGITLIQIFIVASCYHVQFPITSLIGQSGVTFASARKSVTLNW